MAIDNTFIAKRFEKFKEVFVLYSGGGNVPFVECDDITYDDQVYVFTTPEDLQRYAQIYTKEKHNLKGMNYPQAQFPRLYEQLYCMGIDTLQVVDGGAPIRVSLEDLAAPPDYSDLPVKNIPTSNPGLQLSATYFLQELRRPVERDTKEKRRLKEMEEETAVNLLRSRFIVTMEMPPAKGAGGRKPAWRISIVKNKTGKAYQPVYTDYFEFRKFNEKNRGARIRMKVVTYDELEKALVAEAEGYVFNPAGFNLILNRDQIAQMKKRYGKQADAAK